MRNAVINQYFEWIYGLVCGDRFADDISYRKLLMRLHDIEFVYTIPRDENRAADGVSLRQRFAVQSELTLTRNDIYDAIDMPCSILEMMVALAIRCEETIMDDTAYGDRTGQWFWGMINNLGLGAMDDRHYDKIFVDEVITRFLNHEYARDGKGGLFRVRNTRRDLRKLEIWIQMCWYLDSISDNTID